jgi:purine-binding chemotaxis protein CheW
MVGSGVEQGNGTSVAVGRGALVCRIGSLYCALPVEHVHETLRPLPIEALPDMPAFVLGVSVIRGVPTPVVDARKLLATGGAEPAARWVTLKIGQRRVALGVDAVVGVRAAEVLQLDGLPPLLHGSGAEVVSRIGRLDSALLVLLSSAKLVPDDIHVGGATQC